MSNGGDLIPPDESVWRKYSPHHEFPLSSAASVVIHFFIALVVAFFGSLLFNLDGGPPPPPIDNVDLLGGGGGGEGERAGSASGADLKENIAFNPFEKPTLDDPNRQQPPDYKPSDPTALILPDEDKVKEQLARGVFENLAKVGDIGRGGSGSGGGRGRGIGTGDGDGIGPGRSGKRATRMYRWDLSIPFTGADDYADRLQNLGAIIMIPDAANAKEIDGSKRKFWVYRDLSKRPVSGTLEGILDIAKLDRIYFRDRNPETVGFLIQSLGLPPSTDEFIMFLPKELESTMFREEMKAAGVKNEDELNQKGYRTTFRAERAGNGWSVQVLRQYQRGRASQ